MSYIPDYRSEGNEKHLNKEDKVYLQGYRAAIEDAKAFFDNLDIYEVTEDEEKVLTDARECFSDWMDMEETEMVVSIFESADYIPDDVEIVDQNKPLYSNTKGEKK